MKELYLLLISHRKGLFLWVSTLYVLTEKSTNAFKEFKWEFYPALSFALKEVDGSSVFGIQIEFSLHFMKFA